MGGEVGEEVGEGQGMGGMEGRGRDAREGEGKGRRRGGGKGEGGKKSKNTPSVNSCLCPWLKFGLNSV